MYSSMLLRSSTRVASKPSDKGTADFQESDLEYGKELDQEMEVEVESEYANNDNEEEEEEEDGEEEENENGTDSRVHTDADPDQDADPDNDRSMDIESENERKRRQTACKRCHSHKVKCDPVDPTVEFGPCKRCVKKNVPCEYNKVLKRSRKNVPLTKTAKLKLKNREIEMLKLKLSEKDKLIRSLRGFTDSEKTEFLSIIPKEEKLKIYLNEIDILGNLAPNQGQDPSITESFINASESRVHLAEASKPNLDFISSGILTIDQAEYLLDIFKSKFYPKFPFIELPENLDVNYLRINEPLLLIILVYIPISIEDNNSTISLESQIQLENIISQTIAAETLSIGNKNFQLLKNILLYVLWYTPPELFHNRRYHMFSALCVSMANDLGINGKPYYFYNKDDGSVKKALFSNNFKRLELNALMLAVYVNYMSISLFLKRFVYLQWSGFMEQSCNSLEESDFRGYKRLSIFAQSNHLMEIIHSHFHLYSDQITVLQLSNKQTKLQYAEFRERINLLKQKIHSFEDEDSSHYNLLVSYVYSVEAYLYEPSLQTFIKSSESLLTEYKDIFFSVLNLICQSCVLSLKHFCQLTIEEMAINPLFHTSRIVYTSGMLLRIRYLSLTLPKTLKASILTDECYETIKTLLDKITQCTMNYPKNHFIKKIRIVLGMFIHTCLNQWHSSYKFLCNEIKRKNPNFVDPVNLERKSMTDSADQLGNKHTNNNSLHYVENGNSLPTGTPPNYNPNYTSDLHTKLLNPVESNSQFRNSKLGKTLPVPYRSDTSLTMPPILPVPLNHPNTFSTNSSMPFSSRSSIINHDIDTNFTHQQLGNANNNENANDNINDNNREDNNNGNHGESTFPGSLNEMELQYMAFNDEFWSDLFFGDGTNLPDPIMDDAGYTFGVNHPQ